jgi:hypothetical protein
MHRRRRRISPANGLAGLLKDTSVLALQNHVSLSNLTTIRSLTASSLKARAWDTVRAVVAPIRNVASISGGSPVADDATPAAWIGQDLPRMRRGVERC